MKDIKKKQLTHETLKSYIYRGSYKNDDDVEFPLIIKLFKNMISFREEMEMYSILKNHHHPGYISMLGFNKRGIIFLEYIDGKNMEEEVPQDDYINICSQLIKTVKFLHKRGIFHRDIKPNNVMISISRLVKLIDFGDACSFEENTCEHNTGNLYFLAPELIGNYTVNRDTFKYGDIYALGATIYNYLTKRIPFEEYENTEFSLIKKAKQNPEDNISWSGISIFMKTVLLAMMNPNPKERPELKEVLNILEGYETNT